MASVEQREASTPAEVMAAYRARMETRGMDVADAARELGYSRTYMEEIFRGAHAGKEDKAASRMLRVMQRGRERRSRPRPAFKHTSVADRVLGALAVARQGELVVIAGPAGIGKTTAAQEFAAREPAVTYILGALAGTPRAMASRLDRTGLAGDFRTSSLLDIIGREGRGSDHLFIVDDCDYLPMASVQILRTVWDHAQHGVGIAMLCTSAWLPRLQKRGSATLQQFLSRLAHVERLPGCSPADLELLLEGRGLDRKVQRRIVEAAQGSARRALGIVEAAERARGGEQLTVADVDRGVECLLSIDELKAGEV